MSKPKNIKINCTGYEVAADWYEGASNEILLFLIGFESNKAKYADMVEAMMQQTGMSALALDYTGHGDSPFELDDISPAQHFLEVVTTFDWIQGQHPGKPINVIGTSYGGFHATQLTKYRKFEKLILRVPAIYPPDVFYTKWKDMNVEYIRGTYRHDTEDLVNHPLLKRASEFKGKTLVVTHELDDICPSNVTKAFIHAFHADSWTQPNFKHSILESAPDEKTLSAYHNKIAEWLK